MQEVASILIVVMALFAGLAILGWAYGDFEPSQQPGTKTPPCPPPSPGASSGT